MGAEETIPPINHGAGGKFLPGNTASKGDNHPAECGRKFRAVLNRAVTEQDLWDIARALIAKAKDGDVSAAHELLDRLLGKPKQSVDISAEVVRKRIILENPGESTSQR